MSYVNRVKRHFTKYTSMSSAARSDENVGKITTQSENGNANHRVTAPLRFPGQGGEDRDF